MNIKLRVINSSNGVNNSEILIFQKNVATNFEETTVAWKVIQNLGQGDYHPFEMPVNFQVSSGDSYGNFTPRKDAENGQRWAMKHTSSGDQLVLDGTSSSPTEVEVVNNLGLGAIDANIFKSGNLLAKKTSIAPQEKAVFEFKPSIFIGVASQVEEGQLINSAVLAANNTELSLLGVKSADIVMTGGGPGRTSTPYTFTMQNVVMF